MATFPAPGTTRAGYLSRVWEGAGDTSQQVRRRAAELSASAAGPSTSASMVLDLSTYLADARFSLNQASQVAGIGAYAQQQVNDATIDVAAGFSAMMSAIDNVTATIMSAFPKDAQGRLTYETFTADNSGRQASATFTSTQMAPVKTALDALIATIAA